MAVDTRFKNESWKLPVTQDGRLDGWRYVPMAVLMDIRDELQALNRLLSCPNFLSIPASLRTIAANTTKRKYTRKVKETK